MDGNPPRVSPHDLISYGRLQALAALDGVRLFCRDVEERGGQVGTRNWIGIVADAIRELQPPAREARG